MDSSTKLIEGRLQYSKTKLCEISEKTFVTDVQKKDRKSIIPQRAIQTSILKGFWLSLHADDPNQGKASHLP